jgi:predicted amidohydrolase
VPTGRAHWEVLIRARAIETGAFVLAAAQAGTHADGRETWGHALAVDPWGAVLADLDTQAPALAVVDLDLSRVAAQGGRSPPCKTGRDVPLRASDPTPRAPRSPSSFHEYRSGEREGADSPLAHGT